MVLVNSLELLLASWHMIDASISTQLWYIITHHLNKTHPPLKVFITKIIKNTICSVYLPLSTITGISHTKACEGYTCINFTANSFHLCKLPAVIKLYSLCWDSSCLPVSINLTLIFNLAKMRITHSLIKKKIVLHEIMLYWKSKFPPDLYTTSEVQFVWMDH